MPYCTPEDLENTYGKGKINSWSEEKPEKITEAINGASSEIDGYLFSGGYVTPIIPVPLNIKDYCISIAVYRLLKTYGFLDEAGDKAIIKGYDDAIKYLQGVRDGKNKIPVKTTVENQTAKTTPGTDSIQVAAVDQMDWGGY